MVNSPTLSRNSCQLCGFVRLFDDHFQAFHTELKPNTPYPDFGWVLDTADYLVRSDLPEHLKPPDAATAASVLIPLFWHDNQWQVLFIRRVTNQRDHHSGQVAFPGGRQDASDTDNIATALREAHEEIGLPADKVQVIHVLDDYHTSSNYVVTPVVGIVPSVFDYKPQPSEVDRIFSIPLSWLGDESNVELRDRLLKNLYVSRKVVYYDKYDGELLWGASARMTVSLLQALHTGSLVLPSKK